MRDCSELTITVRGLSLDGEATLSPTLVAIDEYGTEFAASWGCVVEPSEEVTVAAPESLTLAPGLYGLAEMQVALVAHDGVEVEAHRLTEADFGLQLVEIRAQDGSTAGGDVRRRFESIMRGREEELAAGIGLEAGAPDVHEYEVLLFVKDCLLTRPMHLGAYEVTPFGGLASSDAVDVVQEYLRSSTPDTIPEDVARKVSGSTRKDRPCFVVRFPLVRATSWLDAVTRANDETLALCDALSLHRLAYPTPLAAFAKDLDTNSCRVELVAVSYRGNLATGGLAGEFPRGIRANVAKAKADQRLRLYLHLYHEGLLETEPESQYFRLWSLLEVMTGREVAPGDLAFGWDGQSLLNKEGQQKRVGKGIEAQVHEYLRRRLSGAGVDLNFRSEVDQHEWGQLLRIWNRHRNCMAHQGGCFPDDPALCLRNDRRHKACRAAREEVLEKYGSADPYRRALRETVSHCIEAELSS